MALDVLHQMANTSHLASWAQASQRSPLQDMLVFAAQPDVISFALGLPNPSLFPKEVFAQLAQEVLTTDPYALQYGPPVQQLKRSIVELMQYRGVNCYEDQIFLTTGAQQGMSLLVRLLLEHRGKVMAEEVVYTGFQQVLEPFQPYILTIPTHPQTGINVAVVAEILESGQRPAFLYCVPNGHNPLTTSLSLEQRKQLADLASTYRVPIIEDDPYGFLSYTETTHPPIKALNNEWVYYIGSFSKILAPALRTGWIIAPPELVAKLSSIKEASDIDTATFAQRLVAAYMRTGKLQFHIDILKQAYQQRRDSMIEALRRYLPTAKYSIPTHGMFLWVELPTQVNMIDLLRTAITTYKVAFIPGQAFALESLDYAQRSLRLNFSHASFEQIDEGIRRIGQAYTSYVEQQII